MPLCNAGNGDLTPGDAVIEQGIIPDNALAETMPAPEIENGLNLAKESNRRRPWNKTPSMWWIVPITVLSIMVTTSMIAPRTELFIKFVCDELRPEYRVDIDANGVQWRPGPRGTQTNVSLTFAQGNPILDDRVMKPALPHPDKRCSQDPAVHSATAKLSAGVTSAEGMLSFLTLGWWSQYSDRAGRKRVLAISAFTMLIADALLFLVAFNAEVLPGGYRMLILGGVIHGLSGGISASVAASHAYLADCTSPSARSRIFSFWTGCVFAGAALGPSLGSLLNSYSNNLLSTFYIAMVMHIIYVILMVCIIPESLSDEARAEARELYEADMKLHPKMIWGSLWRLTSFVRPLGVFVPRRLPIERGVQRSGDWNLALLGVAAAAVAINVGSYHFKYQYAIKTFHWSSVQLGYWLSLVGFWRALYLSTILPIILKGFYAREDLSNSTDDEKEDQVKKIDLLVARSSLLIDLGGYILLSIVTSQTPFIGATIVLAFGGGFSPSVHSLALALANPSVHIARQGARAHGATISSGARQEIGRLFGAFAIIYSLGAQVIGPAIFGAVFSATVGIYPKAFFWLSAFLVAVALGALGAVCLDITGLIGTTGDPEREPLLA